MKLLPEFITRTAKKVPTAQQNTKDVEGYFYSTDSEVQIAIWDSKNERESKKHSNPFDEYMICISGEYMAYFNDATYTLNPGDELLIPKDTEQWGKCKANTRTIHFFNGKRIKT